MLHDMKLCSHAISTDKDFCLTVLHSRCLSASLLAMSLLLVTLPGYDLLSTKMQDSC